METFGGMIAAALLLTAMTLLLKNGRPEYALLLSIGCVVLFMGWTLLQLIPLFVQVSALAEQSGVDGEYLRILLRCLGICLLAEIGGSLCREAGQLSAAVQIELAGKALVLVNCLPVYQKLLTLALSLLS